MMDLKLRAALIELACAPAIDLRPAIVSDDWPSAHQFGSHDRADEAENLGAIPFNDHGNSRRVVPDHGTSSLTASCESSAETVDRDCRFSPTAGNPAVRSESGSAVSPISPGPASLPALPVAARDTGTFTEAP